MRKAVLNELGCNMEGRWSNPVPPGVDVTDATISNGQNPRLASLYLVYLPGLATCAIR